MISYFKKSETIFYVLEHKNSLSETEISKLCWILGDAIFLKEKKLLGKFVGPRVEMTTPWSTNAVEITKNIGVDEISRIEILKLNKENYDSMIESFYNDPVDLTKSKKYLDIVIPLATGNNFFTSPNPTYGLKLSYYLKYDLKSRYESRQDDDNIKSSRGEMINYPTNQVLEEESKEKSPKILLTIMNSKGDIIRRINTNRTKGYHGFLNTEDTSPGYFWSYLISLKSS